MTATEKRRTYIHDVALRDGLQIEPNFVAMEEKVKLINRLSQTGLAKTEATSFTGNIPN
jgi:hydroxymethylglutaryl-CoA lyase